MDLLELDVFECGPCLRGVNPETQTISVKGLTYDLRTGRAVSIGTVEARKAAEAAVKAIAAEEGIEFEEEREARERTKAEERRRQHELLQASQLQTVQAIHAGALDEVRVGPNGRLLNGPIRAADAAKAEAREKARRQAEREQRERDLAKAIEADRQARASGPGVGGHRVARVSS